VTHGSEWESLPDVGRPVATPDDPAQLLDRPVWGALTSRQTAFARGDARALRFAPPYGMFAAAADDSPESLAALAALAAEGGEIALVETEARLLPAGLVAEHRLVVQMVAAQRVEQREPDFEIAQLTEVDALEMRALATSTRPGPFFERTHQLGRFVGVRAAGRLIAMAGERMKMPGFTEVSGVCTDPACRGRGLAGALMRQVGERIWAQGETPFLHTYAYNTDAIRLYRALGYGVRREMIMTELASA
jgi:hypothetical protein